MNQERNQMIRVVIDTNAFISSLSTKSKHHKLIELIRMGEIDLFVTNEIVLEYEEKLKEKYNFYLAESFIEALKEYPNVNGINVFYNWFLLDDLDDNKFVDCYIAANADYLLTNDNDFNKLKKISFPKINLITLQDFLKITT